MPDDLGWLRGLQDDLWPPGQEGKGVLETPQGSFRLKLEARRQLSEAEWRRVREAVSEHGLVVEMIGTNMFGGVGVRVFEHPPVPGVDEAFPVLTLTQAHLPGEVGETASGPTLGACLREAWTAFNELASTERNREWLRRYGLEQPRDASAYDY